MIALRNVTKSFGEILALKSINLSVCKGKLHGLIGPDGAGKTTLFRILTTLYLPDSGHVTIDGMDVVKSYKKIRRILGYMPGKFSLYPDLTVEENLKFFAAVFNVRIEENYELIRPIYSQIEPFKKRRAGALSGGMKQKLALSCALIHKPEILLLDEPTTGVDAVSRREFWNMLDHLISLGLTILVSTPYMDEAARCHKISLIHEGDIFKTGSPHMIVKAFHRPLYSLKTAHRLHMLTYLRKREEVYLAYPSGQSIHFSLHQSQKNIEKIIQSSGISYTHLSPKPADIEDFFMERMGGHAE
ncbi:ABC transporter ATP-binding protein [Fidelibacter multiformis]|jgi:ABC-type multidrug transport system ATPase subunit|uniref:ABC transporter ATP-binding protein n=1 Tax=Fidelibacter multiformis TaxID=3377529 RepID=UPI0037DDA58F